MITLLFFLGLITVLLFAAGRRCPKSLFILTVCSLPILNFAFFTGEVSSRATLPDALFAVLMYATFLRLSFNQSGHLDFRLPVGPLWVFGILTFAILCSLTAPVNNYRVLFGEGQPLAILFGIAIFLLAYHYSEDEEDMRKFLHAWMIAAVIAVIFAFWDMGDLFHFSPSGLKGTHYELGGYWNIQEFFGVETASRSFFSPFPFRIQGSFRNPGQLAIFALTTYIVLLAYLAVPGNSRKKKILIWMIILSLFACTCFTARSSSFISFGFGLLLISFYLGSRSAKLGIISLAVIPFGIAGISIAGYYNKQIFLHVFERNISEWSSLFEGSGFFSEQLRSVWDIAREHPFRGIGFGRFVYSDYHPLVRGSEMHSTVLQFIAETGVLGTLAYGTFMVYLIWVAFSNARRFWGTTWERFYVILFLGFMTLIPSYFYNRHLRERTFWLFIALFFISRKVISREALKCRSERKAIAPLEKSS